MKISQSITKQLCLLSLINIPIVNVKEGQLGFRRCQKITWVSSVFLMFTNIQLLGTVQAAEPWVLLEFHPDELTLKRHSDCFYTDNTHINILTLKKSTRDKPYCLLSLLSTSWSALSGTLLLKRNNDYNELHLRK